MTKETLNKNANLVGPKMILGLSGGIAAGKSRVRKLFAELGVTAIDAEDLMQEILSNDTYLQHEIINKFRIQNTDNVKEKTFNSTEDRLWMENLLHDSLLKKIKEIDAKNKAPYWVLEIPFIIESHIADYVDRILTVKSRDNIRLERATKRDQCSIEEMLQTMARQASSANDLPDSDDIIENSADIENLKQQVKRLHQKYQA